MAISQRLVKIDCKNEGYTLETSSYSEKKSVSDIWPTLYGISVVDNIVDL